MKKILLTAGVMALFAGTAAIADDDHGRMGRAMGPAMMGANLPETPFAEVDADGSGSLSLEEFLGIAGRGFADADANGDGGISADEMTASVMRHMQEKVAQMSARMVENLDKNGDGLIQEDEMPDRADPARMLEQMFSRIDTNDDGSVSAEEYGAAAAFMQEMAPRMGGEGGRGGMRGDGDGHGHMGGWGGWFFGGRH